MSNPGFQERSSGYEPRRGLRRPLLTQAADGLPRRAFTNNDIAKLIESGVIDPDEHFELIKGDIVPMNAEYDRHARARQKLIRVFMRALGDEWFVATEASLFLADDIEFRPDLHIFPASIKSDAARGPDVLLAVELASTTQKRDFEIKAPLYSQYGVRELWVIDLDARTGLIYDRIENSAYLPGRTVSVEEVLSPIAFPTISLKISDLY
jgi:Uma2 family endonuclease